MKRLFLLPLFFTLSVFAVNYTEFYVQTTGNVLNSGHTPDDSATFTASGGTWVGATGIFTKSGLNPVAGGVTNGAWASVYPDGTTTNVFVARVTAADDTADTITVSITAKAGTAPADDAIGATTIRVGGAWRGPNTNIAYTGASDPRMMHPFNFAAATLTNAAGNVPCINFKTGTYSVTNAMTHSVAGPIMFSGYTTTVRDGGKAIFDGGTVYPTYILLTVGANNNAFSDLIFDHNGAAGNQIGLFLSGSSESIFTRCVFRNMRRAGISSSGTSVFLACEAYGNNTQNSAGFGGFNVTTDDVLIRCVSHDNTGANSHGFLAAGNAVFSHCISFSNGGNGFTVSPSTVGSLIGCDSWSNGGAGIDFTGTSAASVSLENCNFFKNGTFGINSSGSAIRIGVILNCAFGSGTQTNTSGNIGTTVSAGVQGGIEVQNSLTYAADLTPWIDPTVGNFKPITGAIGRAAGRGAFTTWATNGLILSYPDIGAAQAASTNSSASSHVFGQ